MVREKEPLRILVILAEQILKRNALAPRTVARLEKGLQLYQESDFTHILVSGGIFNPPRIQTVSAAELMQEWLMNWGIEREFILTEDKSLDSFQKISFSMQIIGRLQKDRDLTDNEVSFVLISDALHLERIIVQRNMLEDVRYQCSTVPSVHKTGYLESFMERLFFLITTHDPEGQGRFARFNRWLRCY